MIVKVHKISLHIPDSAIPSSSSNASLSCISSGCLWSYSLPSRTANRHWWMQMYCCSVWTIHTLSFLISYTIPKISTTSYFLMPWRIRSMAIMVPDLPTPALQWTTIGRCSGLTRSRNARTNLTNVWGGSGTPKSGQVVKWKCRMVLTVSPLIMRNSFISQSG